MLLGQVLQLVVIQIAAQANRGQHKNLPIIHSLSPQVVARVLVDIVSDEVENFIPQLWPAVEMLKRSENGNDLIATVEIQLDTDHAAAIQSSLAGERPSHLFLLEDERLFCRISRILRRHRTKKGFLFEDSFGEKAPQKRGETYFRTGTS